MDDGPLQPVEAHADGGSIPPYRVKEQVGHLLRRAYQRHLAIFQKLAEDHNVTSVQFVTLCVLKDIGPCSQRTLVEATAIDQATIRGITERLEARGFIETGRDQSDGRKVVMSIRPDGERLLEAMYPRGHLISERTLEPLSAVEQVALLYLLRKIADADAT